VLEVINLFYKVHKLQQVQTLTNNLCHHINHKLWMHHLQSLIETQQMQQQRISDQAVALGAFGGGREGVATSRIHERF